MSKQSAFQDLLLNPRTEKEQPAAWLYKELRLAVVSGRLKAGTRLPSSRDLARQYGLARGTVVSVYSRLRENHLLISEGSAGSFAAGRQPGTSKSTPAIKPQDGLYAYPSRRAGQIKSSFSFTRSKVSGIAFRCYEPALDLFPVALWSKITARVFRQAPVALYGQGDPCGYYPLRAAIAEHLGAWRGVRCSASQVIITSGSQQALDLIGGLLMDEGDEAWIEDPGNIGAVQSLRASGVRIAFVPVDAEGLVVKRGQQLSPRAKLIYTTPTHQFPLGMFMSQARRRELLDWSSTSGSWIVEDEHHAEYCYGERPLPSLLSMGGHQNVLYVGSFTKLLFNAIRLGFIIIPPRLVDLFNQARSCFDRFPATLDQAVLADFIQQGHFGLHVRRMREVYKERHSCLESLIREYVPDFLRLQIRASGMSTVAWLPPSVSDRTVSSQLLSEGVETLPLSLFCSGMTTAPALILGFAGCGPDAMKTGIETVARFADHRAAEIKSA